VADLSLHHHDHGDLPDPRLSDGVFPVDAGAEFQMAARAVSPGHGAILDQLSHSCGLLAADARAPLSFFLYSEFSYTMALVQLYVVLAVGPIFFSLAKIDRTLLEAARDMGATPFQIFREIIAPLSLPGVAIGMIFIFVAVMGEFATAVVVYGGKASTTGTVILTYYVTGNYPFAAVNAFMLMVAMMMGVVIILRLVDIRKEL
jgi:putative spermidine/putrescine transport system permease protein